MVRRGKRTGSERLPEPAAASRSRTGRHRCAGVDDARHVGTDLAGMVRERAHPLRGTPGDHDPLLDMIGDARVRAARRGVARHARVLPRARAQITKRLIAEKGFIAVAVEADWPDAYRVNRFVRGAGDDADAHRRARRLPPLPAVDVAQRRRARLRRLAARAQRRAAGRARHGRLLRARSLQPARVDGGGARAISTASIPTAARARAGTLCLLRPLRRGPAVVRLRCRRIGVRAVVRGGRARGSCVELQAVGAAQRRRRRLPRRATSRSSPSRTRAS